MAKKNLIISIVLGLALVAGIVAGVTLPVAQPQVILGSSQAITNYMREMSVTGNGTVSGSLSVTGSVSAAGVTATYLTGTLRTTSQPSVTNLGTQTYLTATNFTLNGLAFTYTAPITITGVLTKVRLLYYQVP